MTHWCFRESGGFQIVIIAIAKIVSSSSSSSSSGSSSSSSSHQSLTIVVTFTFTPSAPQIDWQSAPSRLAVCNSQFPMALCIKLRGSFLRVLIIRTIRLHFFPLFGKTII